MRKQEFEAKVREIVERVLAGLPNEDSITELKTEWPDSRTAARQVAGLANAAGGHPVIWIIGVDEKGKKVVGANAAELSEWHSRLVSACESGHAPGFLDNQNIPINGKVVVGLLFDTSNAPYLVNNAEGKGNIAHEVPWRQANSTRTARRADLLKILLPIERVPRVDLLHGDIRRRDSTSAGPTGVQTVTVWALRLEVFVYPSTRSQLSIPSHRCSGELWGEDFERVEFSTTVFSASGKTVRTEPSVLMIDGPGHFITEAEVYTSRDERKPERLDWRLSLPVAEADFRAVELSGSFTKSATNSDLWS